MSSIYSIYSNSDNRKDRFDHIINTVVENDSPPITYTRVIAAGQPVHRGLKIHEYWTEPLGDLPIPVQEVDTYQDYIAGCTKHERCLGHFCRTPNGNILLPQKLASTVGVMSNQYAKLAQILYDKDSKSQEAIYRKGIKGMMLTKTGKMRGDMPAGVVDSSARLVISICWELADNEMAVPREMAKNMAVLRTAKDEETGLPLGYYVEDHLREEDWVIVVRPPSLWAGNVQPMKVVLWNHECLGLNPSRAREYHADHDGDEMQLYFLDNKKSIEQCKRWTPLSSCKFQEVLDTPGVIPLLLPPSAKLGPSDLRPSFMKYSTISIRELTEGVHISKISEVTKMRKDMVNIFVDRQKNLGKVICEFPERSIRGIRSIMAQQLNQGILGDMSRQAKLAASCVSYKGNGVFHIKISKDVSRSVSYKPLENIVADSRYPLLGNSCMRAIMQLCSKAQQAALDSHRVSTAISSKLDIINNMIRGGEESLAAFKIGSFHQCTWKYIDYRKRIMYCITNNNIARASAANLVAAYHPVLLKAAKLLGKDIKEICKKGIIMVCNYYDIELSILELYSLVELFCYRCDVCPEPITTKIGIQMRNARWMVVLFANHYGKYRGLQESGATRAPVKPETITEASVLCNFDYI